MVMQITCLRKEAHNNCNGTRERTTRTKPASSRSRLTADSVHSCNSHMELPYSIICFDLTCNGLLSSY